MALRQALRGAWPARGRCVHAFMPGLLSQASTVTAPPGGGGSALAGDVAASAPGHAGAWGLLPSNLQQTRGAKTHGKGKGFKGKGGSFTPPWEQKAARKAAAAAAEDASDVPALKLTLRKLQVLVHPDKFHQNEEARQTNTDSLAALQGFLSSIRNLEGQYPPANHQMLHFFIPAGEGAIREVKAQMRTTGGNCRNLVESQLGQLFRTCGLPEHFKWDAESWTMKDAPEEPKPFMHKDEFVPGKSTAAPDYNFVNPNKPKQSPPNPAAAAAAAEAGVMPEVQDLPAGVSHENLAPGIYKQPIEFSDDEDETLDMASAIEELDPVLEALAAVQAESAVVQWMTADDERDQQLRVTAVDHLEANGWKIGSALQHLWSGERDEAVLTGLVDELDPNSRALVVRILEYAHAIEAEHGPPVRILERESAD